VRSVDSGGGLYRAPRSDVVHDRGGFRTRFNFPGRALPGHDDHEGNDLVTDTEHMLVMNAGSGVRHEELTREDDPSLWILQLFVRPHSLGLEPGIQHEPLPDVVAGEWRHLAGPEGDDALEMAADAGVPPERTLLFGFSQGACLAAEFVARTPRRYGGLVALSGGLLGERVGEYEGSLDGTPVFLGCSATDPYVSAERVRATAAVFEALDGRVTARLYEGLGHAINDEEMHRTDALVGDLLDDGDCLGDT
jgi:hypothetical protein